MASFTPLSAIPKLVSSTRTAFKSGKTLSYQFRMRQLKQLRQLVVDHARDLIKAGQQDMYCRSEEELQREEIQVSLDELDLLMSGLPSFMQDVAVAEHPQMGVGKLHYTPMGNTLIIGPWNFPLNLCVVPLAGAISAGCTAILKPSEVSPAVAELLAKLIPLYLDNECFRVVLGAVDETTALLQHQFDLIFFTGAPAIGKIVASAAAKHLTPCILELGGKNWVIVDDTVDMEKVADALVDGRYLINGGQNCTSPDFVVVNRAQQSLLIEALKRSIAQKISTDPKKKFDAAGFHAIINQRHFNRLTNIVLNTEKENIVAGGHFDESELYIEPVVIKDCNAQSYAMQQEMFGPILCVYPVDDVRKDAIDVVQSYPKPLISFVFSEDKAFVEEVITRTDSGAVTVNGV
eukprot:CAMPEP_0202689442 /NCGR_PEP_ID=MMETSP1385-20130828/4707_1 /ASSEMBLY_ACC=CAM_ASM_000861 /TAXON_ID=933848 /ORGANISM="Elphidium margaritaceum" /LENGTH=404 /DNA_ID=CAMNT_0049344575 /DNA_START=17 /DNA_END=1227 /DNA_ORIENTATION=+